MQAIYTEQCMHYAQQKMKINIALALGQWNVRQNVIRTIWKFKFISTVVERQSELANNNNK